MPPDPPKIACFRTLTFRTLRSTVYVALPVPKQLSYSGYATALCACMCVDMLCVCVCVDVCVCVCVCVCVGREMNVNHRNEKPYTTAKISGSNGLMDVVPQPDPHKIEEEDLVNRLGKST